ncbi:granzyme F-like [Peromyscus californicus insignis]|uniref:granzyme F-like n=1 Tax=Peromyscus californicus insignis TaxID=564181 RepID=UPI0022A75DF8|nr:granzyme F-like [Peromyscus californicus insignis]
MPPVLILLTLFLPLGAEEIIGGHEVKPHSRPYMAYVTFLDDGKMMLCGGFLVKDNFVLTAAHCLGRQEAVLIIQDDQKCKLRFHRYIKTIQICAGDPKEIQAAFKGDSGGPLVCDNRAYGVLAYVKNKTIAPGIFTKVVSFLQWIRRSMKPSNRC